MKRVTLALLFIVLIIATFLRLYHLTTTPPGLYPDEAMNGSNALEVLRTHSPKVYYPENNGREGLFMNIQAISLAIFGQLEPWVLRLPSALFGILTVLGMFFLARSLFKEENSDGIALFSAFLLATSFWHIVFSRVGFRAIMAPFFVVWSLYFFLSALSSQKYIWRTVLAGIFFGLGFYSYIAFRIMPLLFLLFIPYFKNNRSFWKITAIFVVVTAVIAMPIGVYYLAHPADFFGRATEVAVTSGSHPITDAISNAWDTIKMLNIAGDANWRHNLSGRPELFWPVGILFWIGFIVSVWTTIKKRGKERFSHLLLLGWLLLAALPAALSNESVPHALRSILMISPIMILAAIGGAWLYGRVIIRIPREARTILVSLLLVLLCAEAYHTYFVLWAKDKNVADAFSVNYVEMAKEIRALPQATPKYIVVDKSSESVTQLDPFTDKDHDVPMRAQTVMFMTDSFSPERQRENNIHYVVQGDEKDIPSGAKVFNIH